MSSYLVTGASRGLGFEYLRQLSSNPNNVVIGLVRDKASTDQKVANELNRTNIHVIQADVTDYEALKKAVHEVSKVTGGSLDYLIANAGYMSPPTGFSSLGELRSEPTLVEKELLDCFNINVVGNIHLFSLFLPLILEGRAKKVIAISTALADEDFVLKTSITTGSPYSISKAALNLAVAKFAVEYAKEGVLFMSISPGMVDTRVSKDVPLPEDAQKTVAGLIVKLQAYAPHFTGPITPEVSVRHCLSVIEKASLEAGDAGSFVSQYGNKQWL